MSSATSGASLQEEKTERNKKITPQTNLNFLFVFFRHDFSFKLDDQSSVCLFLFFHLNYFFLSKTKQKTLTVLQMMSKLP